MSLQGCPLLYVFLESTDVRAGRNLFEQGFGLELIEVEPHLPHHRHGVVKYDAGKMIVSLNEATHGSFRSDCSDGLRMIFEAPSVGAIAEAIGAIEATPDESFAFTDKDGHHYQFDRKAQQRSDHVELPNSPALVELRLVVKDLDTAVTFYTERLGLRVVERSAQWARFATGSATLTLVEGQYAPDARKVRAEGYLIVFYTSDIEETFSELVRLGAPFKGGIASSEIGRTIRFYDPSGHRFCVYEPSPGCLEWGSGAKVLEIAGFDVTHQ
jgi:catechol 2,3-dioxygenase-like lactoylglutathione lyase family enzyme